VISSVELSRLTSFLKSGKAIYIEGNDFARDHKDTEFFNLLGCEYIDDGGNWYRGRIFSIQGQRKTFADKIEMEYLDIIEPNESPDIIGATEGTLILSSSEGKGRAVAYFNKEDGYKVIVSSFVFGGLIDGQRSNTKKELMKRYLKFLISGK
jgi:hypothetical protein